MDLSRSTASCEGRARRDSGVRLSTRVLAAVLAMAAALLVAACGAAPAASSATIRAVGAENQYANVLSQIGGRYVSVTAIMSNPNVDPHTFEASPKVAEVISAADIVVQNGVGYDSFMNKIESSSPNSKRRVIDVQQLLGLPVSAPNPHLWYKPEAMPAVATAIAADLSKLDPAHAPTFHANARIFTRSLNAWYQAIDAFKSAYPGTPVATTEPVADYMLQAAGTDNLTPWPLQANIMNGVDPSAEDVATQNALFSQHRVKVFLYNQQVTDSLTQAFLAAARSQGIPVVGVYETMPAPGYDYQSWMMAEVRALRSAVVDSTSTQRL